MPAMQRLSALALAALAALVACALAAPGQYGTVSSKPLYSVKGHTKATEQGREPIKTIVPLPPKVDIITSTESTQRESTQPNYNDIVTNPATVHVPFNNVNYVHTKSEKNNHNTFLQSQESTKPNSVTSLIPNEQSSFLADTKITYPMDKSKEDVNTDAVNNIKPNKVNVNGDERECRGDQENIEPGCESQRRPRFQETSLPVNKRFPHAVLFGGTCGGSIISPNWILTAGHCTLFTGGRYVLAGTNRSDDHSGVTVRVKKLHVHPLFTVGPYWLDATRFGIKQVAARWDFLLAELEKPLALDGVTLAAIPLEDHVSVAPGTPVGYAGYGTDHHGGTMRMEMHAMDLKLEPVNTCKKLYQYDDNDMLCAMGYAPKFDSACNGDSGSGLVGGGKLVGVASWVENDATECKTGNIVVFSKVAAVRSWIRDVAKI